MVRREALPKEDHRRWGMPTIWGILLVIMILVCIGCCSGVNRLTHLG
jgi:hypothetical protein